ncbi:hypothetical protein KR032_003750, partial [Drosophila birchii]
NEPPNETCDFYEKDSIQSIFENVEKIIDLNSNKSKEIPKISGNLAKDLSQIIPLFKNIVPKGLKKQECCEELAEYLKEIVENLQDKWEDLKINISKKIDKDKTKIKEKLQDNQEDLGEQLEDVQLQLEHIQEESVSKFKPKCCSKFYRKINNLQNELNNVTTDANDNNQEFGTKLKKINEKLRSQDKRSTEVSETVGKREKNIKEMVEKLENKTIGSNCSENELEDRISQMENRVKEQEIKVVSSASNININLCQENGEKLAKIEYELENILKYRNKQGNEGTGNSISEKEGFEKAGSGNLDGSPPETTEDSIKKLLAEAEKLRESLRNSDLCCEKTDYLQGLGEKLLKSTDQLNQTYDENIKNNALDLNNIESLLKNATDKLESITNDRQSQKKSNQNEAEGEDLKKQLTNIQSELDKAKADFKNLQNKLNALPNSKNRPINSNNYNLNDNFKEELKKFNENWLKTDKRLRLLEESTAGKSLARLLESLQQQINKSESEIGRLENLDQSHYANMKKLTNLENQVTFCQNSCNDLDLINDLLDDIEDTERFLKAKLPNPKKPTNIVSEEGVLVGGVDFVDQVTDPE